MNSSGGASASPLSSTNSLVPPTSTSPADNRACDTTTFPSLADCKDMTGYLDQLFSLRERVAVVTGGSSGIGRAIALALGQAGACVVVIARDQANLADAVAELRAAGCSAASVSADMSDRTAVERAARAAREPFGPPDILVNCAGLNLRPPLAELAIAQWDELMAVNLTAPFLLGQQFAPEMAARGWGRI